MGCGRRLSRPARCLPVQRSGRLTGSPSSRTRTWSAGQPVQAHRVAAASSCASHAPARVRAEQSPQPRPHADQRLRVHEPLQILPLGLSKQQAYSAKRWPLSPTSYTRRPDHATCSGNSTSPTAGPFRPATEHGSRRAYSPQRGGSDNHTGRPVGSVPGRTTVMSVAAKSSPVHSTGCPVRSASAYVKQSPKLSPAGCRPFPYRRQPLIARSAKSASTGTTSTFASRRNRSTTSCPAGHSRASMTMPSSTRMAAGISRTRAFSR